MTASAPALCSMRQACAEALPGLARRHPGLIGLGADGGALFAELVRRVPGSYVDVGIAEANLVGVAAGLALAGRTVCAGAIASFLLLRAAEQVRNDLCHHRLPVKLLAVGAGLSYGRLGFTHHLVEDLSITGAFPHLAVFSPADAVDAVACLRQALELPGPAWIRLAARPVPLLYGQGEPEGVVDRLRPGRDLAIVATGACVSQALLAAADLAGGGHEVGVFNVRVLRPLDDEALLAAAESARELLVAEDHRLHGGLGSRMAQVLAAARPRRFAHLGVDDRPPPVGTERELLGFYGLDAAGIAATGRRLLEGEP